MFWTRSTGTVAAVCSTGTVPVPSVGEAAVGASGLAVDEVLADQRLRPDLAARVLAEVGDPRLRHLGGDDGVRRLALPLLEVEAGGRPGLDAADAEVAAVHEPEGVVEDEPVANGVAAGLASGAHGQRRTGDGRGDDEECCERAPHRTALWSSSQSSRARSSSPSTFEPSSAGASAAPGQRRYWLNLTGHGVPGSVQWTDSENESWPRAYAPSASNPPPVVEKSSNQPRKSVVYGRSRLIVGPALSNASAVSGSAPRVSPTLKRLPPGAYVRSFVSVAMSWSGGNASISSIASFEPPLREIVAREVAHRRAGARRERPGRREERAELARDRGAGLDQRIEVVERGAQVHERRVRAAHERRQQPDRLGERLLLVAERARGPVGVADQRGELGAALGERRDEARAVDQEALERGRVARQLLEQAARGRQRRVEVREALARLVAGVAELARLSLEEPLERAARLGVERVEDLVELDVRARPVGRDRRPVGQLAVLGLRAASARRTGSRSPTATAAGSRRACPPGAARGPPRSRA